MSIKYYNGVGLPDASGLLTETRPYALIFKNTDGYALFNTYDIPTVSGTEGSYTLLHGVVTPWQLYTLDGSGAAWTLYSSDSTAYGGKITELIWANYDLLGTDGTVYLTASEPTDTAPDDGGDGTTGGNTVEPEPTVFSVTHKIKCDLQQLGVRPRINVAQGDTNTRVLELSLYNGGAVWRPHADATVLVTYARADGKGGVYDTLHDGSPAGVIDGNTVTAALVPEMTALSGVVRAAVRLLNKSTGDVISTFSFEIAVDPDPAIDAANASGNYINWFGSRGVVINPTDLHVVKVDSTVTVTATYDDLTTGTSVITLDEEDNPVSVVRNGVSCALTWEGFD